MSRKEFRKICHPEAKILNSLVNCPQKDKLCIDTQMGLDLELIPLPVDQLKIYMRHPNKELHKSSLDKQVELYNALPLNIKALPPSKITRKLKKMTVIFKGYISLIEFTARP